MNKAAGQIALQPLPRVCVNFGKLIRLLCYSTHTCKELSTKGPRQQHIQPNTILSTTIRALLTVPFNSQHQGQRSRSDYIHAAFIACIAPHKVPGNKCRFAAEYINQVI